MLVKSDKIGGLDVIILFDFCINPLVSKKRGSGNQKLGNYDSGKIVPTISKRI
jgi:hypothetical protein